MQHPALFIAVCYERSIMENVHLWAQPLILLTAFIYFWLEAKGSRRELKADIGEELNKIDARFDRFEDNLRKELGSVDSKFDKVDAKFDRFENTMQKEIGEMDNRIARLEDKVDARFDRIERILLEQGK